MQQQKGPQEAVSKRPVLLQQASRVPVLHGVGEEGEGGQNAPKDKKLTDPLPFDLTPEGVVGMRGRLRKPPVRFYIRRRAGSNWRPDGSGGRGAGTFGPRAAPPISHWLFWGGGDIGVAGTSI